MNKAAMSEFLYFLNEHKDNLSIRELKRLVYLIHQEIDHKKAMQNQEWPGASKDLAEYLHEAAEAMKLKR